MLVHPGEGNVGFGSLADSPAVGWLTSDRSCCNNSRVARGCLQIAATLRTGSGTFVTERDPTQAQSQGFASALSLPRPQLGGAVLQQDQAVSARRDPIRQAGGQLPRFRQARACICLWLRVYECTALICVVGTSSNKGPLHSAVRSSAQRPRRSRVLRTSRSGSNEMSLLIAAQTECLTPSYQYL
jgi:hypothetical protein